MGVLPLHPPENKQKGKLATMNRYAVIKEKNPREIVLLRGRGCFWQTCTFCDYHLDKCSDEQETLEINNKALALVTGRFAKLEVINSGSVFELPESTLTDLLKLCLTKGVDTIYFESHYAYHKRIASLKSIFAAKGINAKFKIGVESFSEKLREDILRKGMPGVTPIQIAKYFNECCLLVGFEGQTIENMQADINIALEHFERLCINVFQDCSAPLTPSPEIISAFIKDIHPLIKDNQRIDILLHNKDFGVG